jgi:uncharacterized protein (TIGR03118 family)
MHCKKYLTVFAAALFLALFGSSTMQAQTNSYQQTNLTSDTPGVAANTDPKLVNPWGIAYFPGQTFWIADNNSGYSTVYTPAGVNAGSFLVPGPQGDSNPSTPTGIVANIAGTGFNVNGKPAQFIFDSEDGTITAWNGSDPVTTMVDNSKMGAVYKGLALVNLGQSGTFLLAANFNSGAIDVFDTNFQPTVLTGNLTDPQLPAGYAPFGIHFINQQIYITYALQDQAKHDPVHQAAAGYVSVFNSNGGFVQRLISQGNLNAPWGAVIPPAGFGPFAGKLLIGEFGNGDIDVYDPASGSLIDQLKDANGAVISNASLWDMVFGGGGSSGDPGTLYITAGLSNEQHGLFAAITPNTTPTTGADFSLGVTPTTATITPGQSASFSVTVGGLNGFNSQVSFSCSGEPTNTTCAFSPSDVTPTSGGNATTTLMLTTQAPSTGPGPYFRMSFLPGGPIGPISLAIGFALLLLFARRLPLAFAAQARVLRFSAATLLLTLFCMLSLNACGGGGSSTKVPGTPTGTTTMMVTATSGAISHSTTINLTVQ